MQRLSRPAQQSAPQLGPSCNITCYSHLSLCSCLSEVSCAPRRQLVFAEYRSGPEIAFRPRSAAISDRTPRTSFEINEEFGTWTKPSPPKYRAGCSTPSSGTKLASKQDKALSAGRRYKHGDSSQPTSCQALDQLLGCLSRSPAQDGSIPYDSANDRAATKCGYLRSDEENAPATRADEAVIVTVKVRLTATVLPDELTEMLKIADPKPPLTSASSDPVSSIMSLLSSPCGQAVQRWARAHLLKVPCYRLANRET
jgi:hypothetical protein